MAKSILRIHYEYPFEVIGIVSSAKEYRLCHLLNKKLEKNFVRVDDLSMVLNKQGDDALFCMFVHTEDPAEKHILVGNRGNNAWFFPEIKNVDYLLIVRDPGSWFDIEETLRQVRSIEIVNGAYSIEFAKLKSKENLLFLN